MGPDKRAILLLGMSSARGSVAIDCALAVAAALWQVVGDSIISLSDSADA